MFPFADAHAEVVDEDEESKINYHLRTQHGQQRRHRLHPSQISEEDEDIFYDEHELGEWVSQSTRWGWKKHAVGKSKDVKGLINLLSTMFRRGLLCICILYD